MIFVTEDFIAAFSGVWYIERSKKAEFNFAWNYKSVSSSHYN